MRKHIINEHAVVPPTRRARSRTRVRILHNNNENDPIPCFARAFDLVYARFHVVTAGALDASNDEVHFSRCPLRHLSCSGSASGG